MGVKHDLGSILRIYWSLLLGNIVEWYEFAVYGYLEPYLESKFFRGSAIAAWLGFGVTFFARPFGGVVFGVIGDRLGRSVAINLSIIGMLVGTVGQGCLPTFASGSNALGTVGVVILIILRLLQGMSAAGEISTISTYIAEVGRHETVGRSISLISVTANLGFLSAKLVVFILESVLGPKDVEAWGWRLPFIMSLLPGLVAIWGRRGLPESEAYLAEMEKEAKECEDCPDNGYGESTVHTTRTVGSTMSSVVTQHSANIVIGMFGVAASAVIQYGCFVWLNTYLAKQGMKSYGTMLASLTSRILMILMALPVGWLTDRKGVAWVLFAGASSMAVFSLPLFMAIAADPTNVLYVVMLVGVGFGIIGSLCLTTFFFFVVELFPTAVRGSAMGLSYNLGFSLFGGLAPFAMQASLGFSPIGPGIMLSLGGFVSAASIWVALIMRRRGALNLTHVRKRPYFATRKCCGGIGDEYAKGSDLSSTSTTDASTSDESGTSSTEDN